tara:strand:- start:1670 stop:2143 length:474 start_codon:yes stop_codon:yes gene_type:complete
MAKPASKEFELYVEAIVSSTATNTALDMTDYVDIADNQAFEIHELDIVHDVTQTFPSSDTDVVFQLSDANLADFISHADRASLYICRKTFDSATLSMFKEESFSSITPLIVSKTLYLRHDVLSGVAGNYTLRMKGRIVTPSAKDYMALVLTQTGNVA